MSDTHFWDVYARTYDALRSSIPYQELMASLADALDLQPGMTVLDLGCGTGNLEELLGRTMPDVRVTGVDDSEGMLRRAVRKCRRYPSVAFTRADLSEPLPFPDGSFDRVVANNVLYALPGRADLVAETQRVLRPGGLFAVSDPKEDAEVRELIRGHFAAVAAMPPLRRVLEFGKTCVTLPLMGLTPILLITSKVSAERDAGEYRFSAEDEVAALFTGFADVHVMSAYAGQNWLAVAQASDAGAMRTTSSAMSSDSSLLANDITAS